MGRGLRIRSSRRLRSRPADAAGDFSWSLVPGGSSIVQFFRDGIYLGEVIPLASTLTMVLSYEDGAKEDSPRVFFVTSFGECSCGAPICAHRQTVHELQRRGSQPFSPFPDVVRQEGDYLVELRAGWTDATGEAFWSFHTGPKGPCLECLRVDSQSDLSRATIATVEQSDFVREHLVRRFALRRTPLSIEFFERHPEIPGRLVWRGPRCKDYPREIVVYTDLAGNTRARPLDWERFQRGATFSEEDLIRHAGQVTGEITSSYHVPKLHGPLAKHHFLSYERRGVAGELRAIAERPADPNLPREIVVSRNPILPGSLVVNAPRQPSAAVEIAANRCSCGQNRCWHREMAGRALRDGLQPDSPYHPYIETNPDPRSPIRVLVLPGKMWEQRSERLPNYLEFRQSDNGRFVRVFQHPARPGSRWSWQSLSRINRQGRCDCGEADCVHERIYHQLVADGWDAFPEGGPDPTALAITTPSWDPTHAPPDELEIEWKRLSRDGHQQSGLCVLRRSATPGQVLVQDRRDLREPEHRVTEQGTCDCPEYQNKATCLHVQVVRRITGWNPFVPRSAVGIEQDVWDFWVSERNRLWRVFERDGRLYEVSIAPRGYRHPGVEGRVWELLSASAQRPRFPLDKKGYGKTVYEECPSHLPARTFFSDALWEKLQRAKDLGQMKAILTRSGEKWVWGTDC